MADNHSGSRDRLQKHWALRNSGYGIQCLRGEEQILQAISARAPVSEILNGICCALDCQIGNMASLISVKDDTTNLPEIARNAARCGLHIFFSAAVVAESGEELGSLEMYCCVSRLPSPREFQLIERATDLAAIAIKGDIEAGAHGNGRIQENSQVRRNAHAGLVYVH